MFRTTMTIEGFDPELSRALAGERRRQEEHVELIASENYASPRVLEAQGSVLTNKYAEGYPGRRYYGGCEYVDVVEQLAIDRAKQLFGADYANVQPHSGSQANAAAYLALARRGAGSLPPLFLNQMVHAILRNALDDCADPFVLRAAEMMFRPQRLTLHEGALVVADDELIAGASGAPVSPLVSMLGIPAAAAIDVLTEENAATYWERSDRFDMALDLTAGRRGQAALGEALARFLRHMLALDVDIEPLVEMRDVPFTWYVGLDAEATGIGDHLWNGGTLDAATAERVVALYRMKLRSSAAQIEGPIYLILAMTPERVLRMKPQNMLTGLPVRERETVS